jgi:hypothetical protein
VGVRFSSAVALVAACAFSSTAAQVPINPQPTTDEHAAAGIQPPQATAKADASASAQLAVTLTQAPAAPADPCCKLAALTPVELEIVTPASTKTSRMGEEIRIRVVEPVSAGDKVLIPSGTEGFAEVIQVSRGGFGGKAGELVIGAPYLNLAGQRINLKRFRYGSASGKDRTGQAVIATAVVGLVGMFVSGGNIDIASGTRANAVLTTDTLIPVQQ